MEIYDTTGLKPKVKENNPKFLASEIKKQSNYKKYLENQGRGKNFDAHKAAYKNLPKTDFANDLIKLDFANGHFGYFYKFGMITNGFGIPLHIHFFDKAFYNKLPDDFESAEEQKYVYDNASLFPVLSSFHYRIGHNPDGTCKGKNRSFRLKFVCPKSRKQNNSWTSDCSDKCRNTNSTVTHYTYPAGDLRTFHGVVRGSDEWQNIYKIRTIIEREFSSMKSHSSLSHPNTYNCASMRADVFLNASCKLINVMLAFALDKPIFMRNLNKLLKAA